MNELADDPERGSASGSGERTLDDMANAYSRRARGARVTQGKPPVISGPGVLKRIAEIMALDDSKVQRPGEPAAYYVEPFVKGAGGSGVHDRRRGRRSC